MIDPLALKTEVAMLLTQLIGTYTFSDGVTENAIAIVPDSSYGYNYPNNGTVTAGLEIVIVRPMPQVNSLFGGDRVLTYRWQIVCKQWDSAKSLIDAINVLASGLTYHISKVSFTPPDNVMGIIEQARIEIPEFIYSPVQT